MIWQIAIGISIIANVVTILVQRKYSQKTLLPSTFPPSISYLFGVLPIGLLAGLLVFPHEIRWSATLVWLLLLVGVAMAASGASGFYAASKLTVASQLTIFRVCSVVVIVLGWTILGESLNAYQLIGGGLLLAAALLAIWAPVRNSRNPAHDTDWRAIVFALISATTLGVALVTEKALLKHMDVGGVFLVGWTAQTLGMALLATKDISKANLQKVTKHEWKWSTLMGMANGLTGVFYVYALATSDNISLITALTSVVIPLTVLGAYIFLHEREKQLLLWISLVISFLGLLILAA
jgi:drug/metabolite transporter (DMT)-like permease